MIWQTMTHATLLARVAEGTDPAAWGDFYARYGELIRAFCRRKGLQAADVDDVTQDVLMSLTRAMPGFHYDPKKGSFRGYLRTIVTHAIYRRFCQKRGEARLPEIEETTRIAQSDIEGEQHWEAEWRQYHLRRALATVSGEFGESDLRAFELYALSGRAAPEVAEEIGMSVDSVYQAKSRVLKRLSAVIEQQVQEEG
jgi:RNA polymerase sigma factor (sigma-70 family)